jgi:hypothetical protein
MPYNPDKPFLILDLDQTLISSELTKDLDPKLHDDKHDKFTSYNMDNHYTVYSRPYLQEFLDYAFKNFNVTVWTAATKSYALFIISNIILNGKSDRKLDFIFSQYHCKWTDNIMDSSKKLSMLWDYYKLAGYTENNTVILDDYVDDVHKPQQNNCIIARPFEFTKKGSEYDTFLKDIIPPLDEMIKRIKEGTTGINSLATPVNIYLDTVSQQETK